VFFDAYASLASLDTQPGTSVESIRGRSHEEFKMLTLLASLRLSPQEFEHYKRIFILTLLVFAALC
jgi:hypothetical protein